MTEAWFYADAAWWAHAEAVTSLYSTELAEHRVANPRPNLGDFMVALSHGWDGK